MQRLESVLRGSRGGIAVLLVDGTNLYIITEKSHSMRPSVDSSKRRTWLIVRLRNGPYVMRRAHAHLAPTFGPCPAPLTPFTFSSPCLCCAAHGFSPSEACKDLLGRMLALDPVSRPTAREIASHPWFMQVSPSSSHPLGRPRDRHLPCCHSHT